MHYKYTSFIDNITEKYFKVYSKILKSHNHDEDAKFEINKKFSSN